MVNSKNTQQHHGIFEHQTICGLASPIHLEKGTTKVFLEDYFLETNQIESIHVETPLQTHLSKNKKVLELTPVGNIPPLSLLTVWLHGHAYSILLKRSRKVKHHFQFQTHGQHYEQVCIAGEMNNWATEAGKMAWHDGVWSIDYELNPGVYAYQFVLDGNWVLDPENPHQKDNNLGGINSILTIPEPEKGSQLHTLSYTEETICLELSAPIDQLIVLWDNFKLSPHEIEITASQAIIQIPSLATQKERSHLRIFAYKGDQVSNDLKILLHHGKVLQESAQLKRIDKEGIIMYSLMVDRFYNGNPTIDAPVEDERVHEKANFYGGDLEGIIQKAQEGYFKDLNVNTLWLSPITQNPLTAFQEWPEPKMFHAGYHGYWPTSHTDIDYRFGDYEAFEFLIDTLHQQHTNVILDFVSNHVHEEHPLYRQHPDWVTSLKLDDGRLNVRLWNDFRFSTWFEVFLPTLDYSKPEVIDKMTDVALYWLLEFELDGFRHDATKHIPEAFWRTLTRKIKKHIVAGQQRSIYQVGETFGSRELIGSYTSSGKMDGQFDFNLYYDARTVFALPDLSFKDLHRSLMESLSYYGYHHLMCNITGNHDLSRFVCYAGGGLSYQEDSKKAGWEREVTVGDSIGYQRLVMLTAFIMTIPGIPVIYYGDEIGLAGAEDPDNRRPMKFDNLTTDETNTKVMVSKLAGLRKKHLALVLGEFTLLHLSDYCYAYARSYFDEMIIIAFNKSNQTQSIDIGVPKRFASSTFSNHFGGDIKKIQEGLTVEIPAESFVIGSATYRFGM